MSDIVTYLWFENQAEEAARFYTATVRNSKITDVADGPDGGVLVVQFELDGQQFAALNGGPHFSFTEAISIFVGCDTQEEVDSLWAALTEGGEEGPCGWLKDRYGLSWQVVPKVLPGLLTDPDREKATRVFEAMQGMGKLDIKSLQEAAERS